MKLAIDPGHNCPPDLGAEFCSGDVNLREDVIVLAVAQELKKIAESNGVEVVWCLPDRAAGVGASLRKRVDRSNGSDADLYISIHCNAATVTDEPRGSEVYAISEGGKLVGNRILSALTKLGWKNRVR